MKEKITLFIALSFLVGLTAYKKSFNTDINLANNTRIEIEENTMQENIINDNASETPNSIDYSNCESNQTNTDQLQFSEAFKYYRNCNHDTFIWKETEYTTTLKADINDNLEKDHKLLNEKLDLVTK